MKDILKKTSLALLVVLIAVQLTLYFVRFAVACLADLPIDYEGPTYWGVYLLAQGKNIYDSATLQSAPFMVTIYPPLYYALAAIFQPALGVISGLKMARLISMISLCASALVSYRIFILTGAERKKAWIACFAFLNFFALWIWSSYCRVDMLATALSLFALERFLQAEKTAQEKRKLRLNMLSIILCVASVFTKQSSFIVPASIICYLLLKKRFKQSAIWSLSCAGLFAGIFLFLQFATANGFIQHMQFASKMPFDWAMLGEHLAWIGFDWLKILIILAAIFVLIIFGRHPQKDVEEGQEFFKLSLPFLALTAAFTLYTLGTQYPNTNHAILFYFVLCWIFCQVTSIFKEKFDNQPEQIYSLTLIGACLSCTGFMAYLLPSMCEWPKQLNDELKTFESKRALPPNSLVFTEDPYLCLLSNTKPLFVDVSTFVQVWKNLKGDKWDADLLELIDKKKLSAVIINVHDDSKEMPPYYWRENLVDAIHQKYNLKTGITGNRQRHNLYLPAD